MNSTAVVRSEWIKTRSLRSTVGSLAAVFVATCGIGALVCGVLDDEAAAELGFDPLALTFYGLIFGQVAAIAFGALAVSQEYHHAAVRISLAAVPRRGQFFAAKVAVVGTSALAVGILTGWATLALGQALIGDRGVEISTAGAIRAAVGSGIYLALLALFAAGLAVLLRSGVAVLGLLIPLLLIVPFVFNDMASGADRFLPSLAGQLLVQQNPDGPIGPWAALGITALWAALALVAGWVAFRRRDA